MEQKNDSSGSVCDQVPTLSVKYPWLVAQNLEAEVGETKDQIFYTMHDPLSFYRCRIPQLLGRCIRGCYHGWVILSNHPQNIMWSLWNPVTSKMICLPPVILKDGDFESIKRCCLSSPPNDPTSVLMLTRTKTPTILFCQVDHKRKKLRWKEMSYAKQIRSIAGDSCFLHCLTCCNGKVYALISGSHDVIQVDIKVKDKELVISLLPFVKLPYAFPSGCSFMMPFLKGDCTDLFHIKLGFDEMTRKRLDIVYLFKLDWNSMIWKEMEDLKDGLFFVNLAHDDSVFHRYEIASELGGYIHILGNMGKVIYSYDVKDRTISLSSLPCLVQATHVSLWECRLQGDDVEIKSSTSFKPEDDKDDEVRVRDDEVDISNTGNGENCKPCLLTIPFDILKKITEFCIGIEYLNFRAACRQCQLAAPVIRWRSETALRRLRKYSLVSPWLVVLDKHRGVTTFTDPMSGEKYFMKTPRELVGNLRMYCCKYGWLLLLKFRRPAELLFYNPFTNAILHVPEICFNFESVSFSAPPTSPDCILVGLSASTLPVHAFVYFVNRESSWRVYHMDFGGTKPHTFVFSTFYGQDIYALNQGALNVFREIEGCPFWGGVVAEAPRGRNCYSVQNFLVSCDQHLLLVVMDEFGKSVEVLKLNDSTQEWEKLDSLGRHMIYICGTMGLCMEAKMPEMENKIYFPLIHSKSGKIVFYSLETRRYYTFDDGKNIQQCLGGFFGTKYHTGLHAWIEPSWSDPGASDLIRAKPAPVVDLLELLEHYGLLWRTLR